MNEVTNTKHWNRALAWLPRLVCAGASLYVVGCATHPIVHVTEVPIDQFSATGPAPAAPGETTVAGTPAVDVAATEAAPVTASPPGGPASPPPVNTTPAASDSGPGIPAPPFPKSGTHAKPAHAQRLTAVNCGQLMDRYVILFGVSQGLTMAQATKALPGMKAQVQGDANYAGASGACVEQNSKKQYQCAMKATTVDAWKSCLE